MIRVAKSFPGSCQEPCNSPRVFQLNSCQVNSCVLLSGHFCKVNVSDTVSKKRIMNLCLNFSDVQAEINFQKNSSRFSRLHKYFTKRNCQVLGLLIPAHGISFFGSGTFHTYLLFPLLARVETSVAWQGNRQACGCLKTNFFGQDK